MDTHPDYTPAPYWRRLVARIIDLTIAFPLTFLAAIPIALVFAIAIPFMSDDAWASMVAFSAYATAYSLIEYFLLRRRSGQTLGKGLLGLRVVPAGNPSDTLAVPGLSARSALIRMGVIIGPFLAALGFYYATYDSINDTETPIADAFLYLWLLTLLVSTITALADRRAHRTLHDAAASTRVVRAPRRGINMREDFQMLVPGKVNMEKNPPVAYDDRGDGVDLLKRP